MPAPPFHGQGAFPDAHVENLKEHMITIGHQGPRSPDHVEPQPIIDHAIPEQAIWDCVSCGACMEECPVVVEHVPTIIDPSPQPGA